MDCVAGSNVGEEQWSNCSASIEKHRAAIDDDDADYNACRRLSSVLDCENSPVTTECRVTPNSVFASAVQKSLYSLSFRVSLHVFVTTK